MVEKRDLIAKGKEKKEVKKEVPYPVKKCYTNIGEPLPSDVTLTDIIATLPKEIFQKTYLQAYYAILKTVVCVSLGLYCVYLSPWYFLPFAWLLCGTAYAGIFMIAHDCGHRCLFPSLLANDIFGELSGMLVLYPFHSWRVQHNHHHAHTNKLHVDNAWQPTHAEEFINYNVGYRFGLRLMKEYFFWNTGSIAHELMYHFQLSQFSDENKPYVRRSLICVYLFALAFIPSMIYYTGFWGFCKFYVIPWIIFHFWMSTFTLVHHTLPHVPFKPESEWKMVDRFASTVHCRYPFWVEWMCHQINIHIPHHLNTNIPSYNLKRAHAILKQKWGKHMHEVDFGWELMIDIISKCHMYHKDNHYQSFEEFWQNEGAELQRLKTKQA